MNPEAVIRDCVEVMVEGPETSVLRLGLLVPLSGPLGIVGRMRPAYQLRLAANIINGSTLAGVVVAGLGGARLRLAGEGLLVGSGYRLPVPPAPAFCLGNVLVTRLGDAAFTGNPRLFAHEARHATQYACCAGVVMLPLYGIAAVVSWALTGDFASRNVFERRAGLADGGYAEKDLRPFLRRAVVRAGQARQAARC